MAVFIQFTPEISAHDFWIEPSTFRAASSELIFVRLKVGQDFDGASLRRNPTAIQSFRTTFDDGVSEIQGNPGDEPAGFVLLPSPGLHVLSYQSHPTKLMMNAERFQAYLQEAGLDSVIRIRRERGQSETLGRERFIRCAKAMVLAGKENSDGFDRILGLTLELIPETNPHTIQPGHIMSLRLLHDKQPQGDALVFARNMNTPDQPVSARTDEEGRVRFCLPEHGQWLISCIQMVQVDNDNLVDWESRWASLTFQIDSP
ncbi:MAG: DUF4198 domain-containing protein [Planctomycetaceae bacterium]